MDYGSQELNKVVDAVQNMSTEEYNKLYLEALEKDNIQLKNMLDSIENLLDYAEDICIDKPLTKFFSDENKDDDRRKIYDTLSKIYYIIHSFRPGICFDSHADWRQRSKKFIQDYKDI